MRIPAKSAITLKINLAKNYSGLVQVIGIENLLMKNSVSVGKPVVKAVDGFAHITITNFSDKRFRMTREH